MAAKSKSTQSAKAPEAPTRDKKVDRVQLGVRIEKRLAKVLKGVAEHRECTLGELLEDMLLHGLGNAGAFGPKGLVVIEKLKEAYGLDYSTHDNYLWAREDEEK